MKKSVLLCAACIFVLILPPQATAQETFRKSPVIRH